MDTNLTGEARTRVFTNWDKDGGEPAHSVNFRGSIGYSTNYEDWNLYVRAGASATASLHGNGLQTIAPTVIGGVGYNITQDFNMYLEADISRGYDCQEQKWKHSTKPTITFGFKIEL